MRSRTGRRQDHDARQFGGSSTITTVSGDERLRRRHVHGQGHGRGSDDLHGNRRDRFGHGHADRGRTVHLRCRRCHQLHGFCGPGLGHRQRRGCLDPDRHRQGRLRQPGRGRTVERLAQGAGSSTITTVSPPPTAPVSQLHRRGHPRRDGDLQRHDRRHRRPAERRRHLHPDAASHFSLTAAARRPPATPQLHPHRPRRLRQRRDRLQRQRQLHLERPQAVLCRLQLHRRNRASHLPSPPAYERPAANDQRQRRQRQRHQQHDHRHTAAANATTSTLTPPPPPRSSPTAPPPPPSPPRSPTPTETPPRQDHHPHQDSSSSPSPPPARTTNAAGHAHLHHRRHHRRTTTYTATDTTDAR